MENKQNPAILREDAASNRTAQLCTMCLTLRLPLARCICAMHGLHNFPWQPSNFSSWKLFLQNSHILSLLITQTPAQMSPPLRVLSWLQ